MHAVFTSITRRRCVPRSSGARSRPSYREPRSRRGNKRRQRPVYPRSTKPAGTADQAANRPPFSLSQHRRRLVTICTHRRSAELDRQQSTRQTPSTGPRVGRPVSIRMRIHHRQVVERSFRTNRHWMKLVMLPCHRDAARGSPREKYPRAKLGKSTPPWVQERRRSG